FLDLEARYKTRATRLHVPIARNLYGIGLVGHRVKNRLSGQSRRPFLESGCLDQRELRGSGGPIHHDRGLGLTGHGLRKLSRSCLTAIGARPSKRLNERFMWL